MISQKATALCIYEILKTYSDENHVLTTDKIREKLKVILLTSYASYTKPFFAIIKIPEDIEKSSFLLA